MAQEEKDPHHQSLPRKQAAESDAPPKWAADSCPREQHKYVAHKPAFSSMWSLNARHLQCTRKVSFNASCPTCLTTLIIIREANREHECHSTDQVNIALGDGHGLPISQEHSPTSETKICDLTLQIHYLVSCLNKRSEQTNSIHVVFTP